VTPTAVAFLGAIAVATVVMALIQLGAIIYAARTARRLEQLLSRIERDIQPMIEHLTTMSGEAARTAALAAEQVQRADRLLTDLGRRLDHSVNAVQRALTRPAREGAALIAGVRAAALTLRDLRRRRPGSAGQPFDEDDALFIG
jgi:hypothetical protein